MAICVSKGVIFLFMISLFVYVHLIVGSYARYISYGAIGKNEPLQCGPLHPENCKKHPSNQYERGCIGGEECRTFDPPPSRSEEADEHENKEANLDVTDHRNGDHGKKKFFLGGLDDRHNIGYGAMQRN